MFASKARIGLVIVIVLLISEAYVRGDIIQSLSLGSTNIQSATNGAGQSFTADVSVRYPGIIGCRVDPFSLSAMWITMDLYEGVGYSGSLLATATRNPLPTIPPSNDWLDFDLSPLHLSLTPGSKYTIRFRSDSTALIRYYGSSTLDAYPNGSFIAGNGAPEDQVDLSFRVLAAVPEPGLIAPLALGLWPFRRRRS